MFTDTPTSTTTINKPYHRIVVYLIPDLTSIMPTSRTWSDVKKAFEVALSKEGSVFFPMSASRVAEEIKTPAGTENTSTVEGDAKKDISAPNFVAPCSVGSGGKLLHSDSSNRDQSSPADANDLEAFGRGTTMEAAAIKDSTTEEVDYRKF